jgi:hypothetical protein
MACLKEKNFLDDLYSLYTVGTVRGSREVLPDIVKRIDRMYRGELMFVTEGCVAGQQTGDSPVHLPQPLG